MSSFDNLSEEQKAAIRTDRRESHFLDLGIQYYIAARAAVLANLVPVCGNLYHHAVEALLKAWLSHQHSSEQLRRWGHRLPPLWDAFKADFPGTDLDQFDGTIGSIDPFERLRYPDAIVEEGAQIMIEWERSPYPTGQVSGSMPLPHTVYRLIVNDIDRLVEKILSTVSINPAFFTSRLNDYARDGLTRLNPVADQLVKTEP